MPKIVDRDAYREELLEGSFRLFATHGYSALTLRKLASGLGVSTGTLYHYFTGKEDIFTQLVDLMVSRVVLAGVAEVSLSDEKSEQLRAIIRFARGTADLFEDFLKITIDSTRLHQEQSMGATLVDTIERLQQAIVDVINDISLAEATFIFDVLAGLVTRRTLFRSAGVAHDDNAQWEVTEEQLVRLLC